MRVEDMIIVKDKNVLLALLNHKYHTILSEIISYIADKYGIYITEGYRNPRHAGDVHSTDPVRAIDARFRFYSENTAYQIADDVNNKWEYDPSRKDMTVLLIHGEGLNKHLHIQVHPSTRRRKQ